MLEGKLRNIKGLMLAAGLAAVLGCDQMNYCDTGDDDYMRAQSLATRNYSSESDGDMTYTEKNCGGACTYEKEYDCCSCPECTDCGDR
jgi:hypothetical protein